MKIPKILKIRRSKWTVDFDETIEESYDAVGLCIRRSKRILISPNQTQAEIEDTLIHELLHASWPDGICSDRLEEAIVSKLSRVFLGVLKDNNLLSQDNSGHEISARRRRRTYRYIRRT